MKEKKNMQLEKSETKFDVLGQIPENFREQRMALLELGMDALSATLVVGEKYVKLAAYIRKENVAKKIVKEELSRLGFAAPRISELWKVAQADDETWASYAARQLSLRDVLALTRSKVQQLSLLDASGLPSEAEVGALQVAAEEAAAAKAGRARVPTKTRAAKLAQLLLKLASKMKGSASWTDGVYVLTLSKAKTKPAATTETK